MRTHTSIMTKKNFDTNVGPHQQMDFISEGQLLLPSDAAINKCIGSNMQPITTVFRRNSTPQVAGTKKTYILELQRDSRIKEYLRIKQVVVNHILRECKCEPTSDASK